MRAIIVPDIVTLRSQRTPGAIEFVVNSQGEPAGLS